MKRFVTGQARGQATLFPEYLEDYIADFRKGNGKAMRRVCREFMILCRGLELFSEAVVAIGGRKLKPVNNRDRNFTAEKMKRRLQELGLSGLRDARSVHHREISAHQRLGA